MPGPVIELTPVPEAAPPYDGEPASGLAPPLISVPSPAAPMAAASPPDDWTHRFARILTEIIAGSRPHRQLTPFLTERGRLHLRRIAPSFADGRPQVLRVLTTHPAPDVAEATVIVDCGQRARALALRFERAPRGWVCTDIEAG